MPKNIKTILFLLHYLTTLPPPLSIKGGVSALVVPLRHSIRRPTTTHTLVQGIHPTDPSQPRWFATTSTSTTVVRAVKSTTTPNNNNNNNKNTMIQNTIPQHAPQELLPIWMKKERTRILTDVTIHPSKPKTKKKKKNGDDDSSPTSSIVYWMQRDVRTVDNWALVWAQYLAKSYEVPLHVVYVLPPPPPPSSVPNENNNNDKLPSALEDLPMTKRYGDFLLGGLEHVHSELKALHIPLHIIMASSHETVGGTVCQKVLQEQLHHPKLSTIAVVCDFSPLRPFREWMEVQAVPLFNEAKVPLYQVDTHNIVPVWEAADKRQVGARTLRPRIHRVIESYLSEFPKLISNDVDNNNNKVIPLPSVLPEFSKKEYEQYLQMDTSVPTVDWAIPGTEAGMKQLEFFVQNGLKHYEGLRNDPVQKNICSNLSPWINFGHISFQRVTMSVQKLNKYSNATKSFIEEGVVRRELSDNYIYYTPNDYDELTAAAGWAQETLATHTSDPRDYIYTLEELETSQTHDDLWNAAQFQVVQEGGMHGFLRMYWAKKILEWTTNPQIALRTAQYLNDKYALDGRDPNGFVGVGWSIMGIHDMGWKEREIFGKIRFMNYAGCKRKFKVANFVALYKGASENAIQADQKHHPASSSSSTTTTTATRTSTSTSSSPTSSRATASSGTKKRKTSSRTTTKTKNPTPPAKTKTKRGKK